MTRAVRRGRAPNMGNAVLNPRRTGPRSYAGSAMKEKSAPVTAGAGVPLHRQLFLVLRDEIERGAIAAGDPLPTEQTLCEQFGVSRITVRRALADLSDQGYIDRRHGVGSFVRQARSSKRPTTGGSYMDEMRQTQFETQAQVIEIGMRPVPGAVAAQLDLGADALHITRLRRERRTGEPLMVTEAWLPTSLAPAITETELGTRLFTNCSRLPASPLIRCNTKSPRRWPVRATRNCSTPRSARRCCASTASPS